MSDVLLGVDLTRKQRGVEQALRDAIQQGRLRPGDVLPSTRQLAADLGISRSSAVAAYEQLASEGYLAAQPRGRTRVADGAWHHPREASPARPAPPYRLDLIPGEPDRSSFPRAGWARCTRDVLRRSSDDLFGYGDPLGLHPLRSTLSAYLSRTRGVTAPAERIVIVPGVAAGLAQLARLLRDLGISELAVEDPGFPFQHDLLRRHGLRLLPVPVDGEGIDVAALPRRGPLTVIVTPAHQYPLGVVLSGERRAALTAWARTTGSWIIEDDYDGEFRYDRHPVGSLQGLAPDRVIYAGTASKTLAAGLRLAWLAVPDGLLAPLVELRGRDSDVSQLQQATLAAFISGGHLDRHVRAMRVRYRTRRDQLLEVLAGAEVGLDLTGISAGLHVTARLHRGRREADIVAAALDCSLALWGLRQHYQAGEPVDGFVLGFGRTAPNEFATALPLLRRALRG